MIAAVPLTDSSLQALQAVSAHMSMRHIPAVSGSDGLSVSAELKDPHAVDRATNVRQDAHVAALITDQGSQESTS
jgi:DNA polymerase II small subunit/DNA polymerase delta subunit B